MLTWIYDYLSNSLLNSSKKIGVVFIIFILSAMPMLTGMSYLQKAMELFLSQVEKFLFLMYFSS